MSKDINLTKKKLSESIDKMIAEQLFPTNDNPNFKVSDTVSCYPREWGIGVETSKGEIFVFAISNSKYPISSRDYEYKVDDEIPEGLTEEDVQEALRIAKYTFIRNYPKLYDKLSAIPWNS